MNYFIQNKFSDLILKISAFIIKSPLLYDAVRVIF